MAGWYDSIFGNLPGPPLPGSPRRPAPPQNPTPMFPVNPAQVAGGLVGIGTDYAGQLGAWLATHPGSTPSLDASAPGLARDLTAMLDKPGEHISPTTATTIAAAPLAVAAKAAKKGKTAEEIATGAAQSGIRAYHGSPYDFDRFDISKIGTGEGANAYGRGLYFAGNEEVAKNYRNQLAPGYVKADGSPISDSAYSALAFVQPKFEQSGQLKEGIQDAIDRLKNQSEFYRKQYGSGVNLYDNAVETLQTMDPSTLKPKGRMYEVNINADPTRFIDWDKTMKEQHPDVQAVLGSSNETAAGHLGRAYRNPMFAGDLIGQDRASPDELSGALAKKGIPGIKYLDQGSRTPQTLFNGAPIPTDNSAAQLAAEKLDLHGSPDAAMTSLANDAANGHPYVRDVSSDAHDLLKSGQVARSQPGGTSNYVTFSDDIINILRKYGLAGLGLSVGAGALSASGQSPVSSPAEAAPQGMTFGAQPNWSP